MEEILYLFAMYGIAFGIQHKMPAMWDGALRKIFQEGFTASLLSCTYCVGFHAGWIIYLLVASASATFSLGHLIIYSFAGAAFSYSIDAYVQRLEGEEEDEDSEEG